MLFDNRKLSARCRDLTIACLCFHLVLFASLNLKADVVFNLTPVPYEWEFRLPVLPHSAGDTVTLSVHYARTDSQSKARVKYWEAQVKIVCPHGNRIQSEIFRLADRTGMHDSIFVSDTCRESGKFAFSAIIRLVTEADKKIEGQFVLKYSETYTNDSRSITWAVEPAGKTATLVDSTCRYAGHK